MRQILRVMSGELQYRDGEYFVQYVLYEMPRDGTWHYRYAIVAEDNAGNGDFVAYGDNEARLRDLVLQLGEFVEWR